MVDKSKQAHDLAVIYALVNYSEAKRTNPHIFEHEKQKHGLAYETDFIYGLYMDAFSEYSNYQDDCFDVNKYNEK